LFNRSRDKNSADTAATECVTLAITIIVKKYYNAKGKQLNCQAHQMDGPCSSFI